MFQQQTRQWNNNSKISHNKYCFVEIRMNPHLEDFFMLFFSRNYFNLQSNTLWTPQENRRSLLKILTIGLSYARHVWCQSSSVNILSIFASFSCWCVLSELPWLTQCQSQWIGQNINFKRNLSFKHNMVALHMP